MALVRRLQTTRFLLRTSESSESFLSVRSGNELSWIESGDDSSFSSNLVMKFTFPGTDAHGKSVYSRLYECLNAYTHLLRSAMIAESIPFTSKKRSATQVKAPQLQKTDAVRVSMVSPGFDYEPYALHEKSRFGEGKAKRIEMQNLKHNLKLFSILNKQMTYLEEWLVMGNLAFNAWVFVMEMVRKRQSNTSYQKYNGATKQSAARLEMKMKGLMKGHMMENTLKSIYKQFENPDTKDDFFFS
ncbi:unnamed protein product [Microthlaspi erraticum]|uniref:Uncharacterized protein n=1 Tax=Microthlaspi erraticum TaxID=1685480 RepID=A0A6D2K8X7_9BRAS|nr:unnamed protein product [Microthlaspi erraticum]